MFPSLSLSRTLYLRALGAVGACAFVSLAVQVRALVGSHGILPAARALSGPLTLAAFLDQPSLLWWSCTDGMLLGLCVAGALACVGVVAGLAPRWLLLGAWATYLSLWHAGGPFLSFQWDLLLLETLLLSAFYAPAGIRLDRAAGPGFSERTAGWLLRWLMARLMLGSGVVKLVSGDAAWRDLSALSFHLWTQPLPGPLAPLVHALPGWMLQAATGGMFVIELVLPLLALGPARGRAVAAAGFALLQVGILATGNYGFFNLLTLVLCVPLLEDAHLRGLLPARWRPALPSGPEAANPPAAPGESRPRRVAVMALAAGVALLGAVQGASVCGVRRPEWTQPVLRALAPFGSLNGYGLFAIMTKERGEIRIEGSGDGRTWREWPLPWKPGNPAERPAFLPGHMPRLDWQLWFAALGNCRRNSWLAELQRGLLRGDSPVRALFSADPFPDQPPRYVRTLRAPYGFSDAPGRWWEVGPAAPYCPVLSLEGDTLRAVSLPP
ncbi:MAG: lipase maturation factor family protein [Deltaproteobacteria bacterium]|nr:lipase maturation factor family protein [Deltaproteobacteria bacterium]